MKKIRKSFWLIEVLYNIKRGVLWFIGSLDRCIGKLYVKNQGRNRQADIEAYRGNVCNEKGSPRVHEIIRKLHA